MLRLLLQSNGADKALKSKRGQLLTAQQMDAQNSFAELNAVRPIPFQAERVDDRLQVTLPPTSIVVLKQR